jgi:hypothetical protein
VAADTIMPPVHPGEILLEEFLTPLGVSQYQLAKAWTSRRGGSMRSSTASAVSPRTPRCGYPGTSAPPNGSG